MNFPRMTNRGHTVQVSENSFVATPTATDDETAWKVCKPSDDGATRVAPELYVNIDRQTSIDNNLDAMEREGASAWEVNMDRLDVVRHRAAMFFGG